MNSSYSLQYTDVGRILSRIHREGVEINETDAIEWVGEALEFLRVPEVQEQAVIFMEVKKHEVALPPNFHMVLQIARHNHWDINENNDLSCIVPDEVIQDVTEASCVENPDCNPDPVTCPHFIPYFDMQWQYTPWTTHSYYRENFSPVRLANHSFFNSVVCREHDSDLYHTCESEYTVVGDKLRFSFDTGYIAMSYIKNAVDNDTGYPLIPDTVEYITAITYYLKWKVAQMYDWNGRQGYGRIAQDNERLWLKYARQAKNHMRMPKSLDQFQNLLESTHQLIPRQRRYYGYFGKLGREDMTLPMITGHRRI